MNRTSRGGARRAAFTLIELIVVLTGCSVVLGLTTSLLHQAMRSHRQSQEFIASERNAQRLARQFRLDVHSALAAAVEPPDTKDVPLLRLELPAGGTIDYQRQSDRIVRIAARPGEPTAREEYQFSTAMELDLQPVDSPPGWELTIIIAPPQPAEAIPTAPTRTRDAPLQLHVVAAVGRDLRYASAPSAVAEASETAPEPAASDIAGTPGESP